MSLENVLALFGGLSLFLYGMHMMSEGLENAAGDKLKGILEKITANRFIGVLVGAGITALIQSSSATTVMVVGFVNSRLMTLKQAVWIIMGANIGTTITGQLLALNVSEIAPIMAIIGVVMVTFLKNRKVNAIGGIVAGLGILFIGMDMMSDAMVPLRDSEMFINFMTTVSNPFLGILFGAVFTAIIQSSSASVGILQALANSGLVPLSSAVFILFGQNIGTCITAVLASIGTSRNAKRTTIIHLSFNIIGTMIFVVIALCFPFAETIASFTPNDVMQQIANVHTLFNITTTLVLLPIGTYLAKLAELILPIKEEELEEEAAYNIPLTFVDETNIGTTTIALSSLRKEAVAMLEIAQKNIKDSMNAISNRPYQYDKILKREKRIDYINYQITNYMTKVSALQMSSEDSTTCNALFKCFSDIERIGDHAMNIVQYVENDEAKFETQPIVREELDVLQKLLQESFELLFAYNLDSENESYERIEEIEEKVDKFTAVFRQKQIQRMIDQECQPKDCVMYSEILTDIERISDHLMNIIEQCRRCNFTLMV